MQHQPWPQPVDLPLSLPVGLLLHLPLIVGDDLYVTNPKLIETLEGLLKEAEGVLGDLTDMVSKYKSKLQILDQSVWWLRQKSTAKKYIMKLQDIRTKITELLNSKTRPVNLYFKFNILRTISG